MKEYEGTRVVFVTAPPYDSIYLTKYYRWLEQHGFENLDSLQYPFVLFTSHSSGAYDTWEQELYDIGVTLYSEQIDYTEAPEEFVFVLGRPDYTQGCSSGRTAYVKWLSKYVSEHYDGSCGLNKAFRLESGKNPVCLGRITVRDSRDRDALINEIEQFGSVRLAFVDIRDPYVD